MSQRNLKAIFKSIIQGVENWIFYIANLVIHLLNKRISQVTFPKLSTFTFLFSTLQKQNHPKTAKTAINN